MAAPLFVFTRDRDLLVLSRDSADGWFEAIDVSDGEYVAAFEVTGERVALEVDGHRDTGGVVVRSTGEFALAELEGLVREFIGRTGEQFTDTGDFLLDYANYCEQRDWDRRWLRRPKWLDVWLHGAQPLRFER